MKVVAKILLYNSHGRILVLRRGETHPHFPGHLDLPGGEVEAGEQVDQAVVREVREETGLHILLCPKKLV
jgi:mutator protein MutT